MVYKLGKYRTYEGKEFTLRLDSKEKQLFQFMWKAYENATSWLQFQELTAETVKNFARHISRDSRDKELFKWEGYQLYQIRADLLRNVGVKTGELKGELSDMFVAKDDVAILDEEEGEINHGKRT